MLLINEKKIRKIDFPKWPIFGDEEKEALNTVLNSAKWGSTKGNEVNQFEQEFSQYNNAKFAIATTSGTTALSIALKAAGIGPGDEVIVPGYTFIASATAILDALAKPVFADISSDTLNIDPEKINNYITPYTKAIMPVHFAGRPAEMDIICKIAEKNDLIIIEDACQAWGSKFKGENVSTFGLAGAFSFQSSKNITSGEGGIILSNNAEFASLARSLVNCGRSKTGLWYAHYNYGGNYRLTEFQAAILRIQLKRYPELHRKRFDSYKYLEKEINNIDGYLNLKKLNDLNISSCHIFPFLLDIKKWNGINKNKIVDAIRAEGIPISAGYSLPIYKQPVFLENKFGANGGPTACFKTPFPNFNEFSLENVEDACYNSALWITQNILLSDTDKLDLIIQTLDRVFKYKDELKN